MATIAEFEISLEDFAMSQTLTERDGIELDIERVVAQAEGSVMPYVWVECDDFEAFDRALETDPSVEAFERISETEEWLLYRMNWTENIHFLMTILVEYEGTVLSADATSDRWSVRVLFPTRTSVSETFKYANDKGMSLTVAAIYEMSDKRSGRFGLTEEQTEALTLATERGFYRVPREATLMDLSEKMEISHQSLSERLRRGQHTLNSNTLLVRSEQDDSAELLTQVR
ncbi:bacterio-opsin activator domain-containing protein [Natronorarus salvus]|uniref:bacterio-opsin activator domain-containing protein n=1 Tax=Natronorarus salvus TaxID=3117733 RepID=UPI002F266357